MASIHRLDPTLVNKIAAGEVIERPASLVKELMENALDAGATSIEVELADGGASLVRVTDDGVGITPDDLPLAVAPHATSKLNDADDLFRIGTLGFRGEALASIAAVSNLRIVSRPRNAESAHELTASDDRIDGPRPCAAPHGTTVEARDLFFNVPARRKFLRQPATETSHVTEHVARIALAHPHVAIRQINQGRDVRRLASSPDRRSRIADFYGPELAAELFSVRRQERGLTVEALIAPPAAARATAKWQYVFLNGRFISDRMIHYAIREAYRGLVEPSRHAVVFLFLTTDPSNYDVNVHPTKIEVRWRDGGLVQSQVLSVLRESLLSRDLTPAWTTPALSRPTVDAVRQTEVRAAIADFLRNARPEQRLSQSHPHSLEPCVASSFPASTTDSTAVPLDESRPHIASDRTEPPAPETTVPLAPPQLPSGRAIQIHNTYLVVEADDGVVIIDQHALHERILYEQFRERILAGRLESQRLLLPETVDLSAPQLQAALHHADLLGRIGIELSPFGPNSLAVQSFPSFLQNVDVRAFVRDVLDRLAEPGQAEHPETLLHSLLDMMACKAAVKAGDPLTAEDIAALLAQRHLVDRSSNCPHGRPTTLRLSLNDLERQFKRT